MLGMCVNFLGNNRILIWGLRVEFVELEIF